MSKWPITDEIKEQVVDELLKQFRIEDGPKMSIKTVVENARGMLDDATKDDVEIWITKQNVEFCVRLSVSISAHHKRCIACKDLPMRTVCQRCKDTGLEPEVRDE